MLPIDRTAKSTLDNNLVNGNTSDAPVIKNSNDTVYNTIDELYNFTSGLVAGGTLQPYPAFLSRQALINGNFDIWQRGTSRSDSTDIIAYLADRWAYTINKDGGTLPTITQSKLSLSPGELSVSASAFRINTNGFGSALGVNSYSHLSQIIENGTRYLCGIGKKITVSFWAKSDISGKKIGVAAFQNYGTGGTPTANELLQGKSFTLTSTWTKYAVTFISNTLNGKVFGTNNDDGLMIQIYNMWGTNLATRFAAFGAETFGGVGNIDIAQVQVNTGDQVIPYQPKSIAEELQLCRRYLFTLDSSENANATYGSAFHYSATLSLAIIPFPVKMRTIPTLATSAANTFSVYNSGVGVVLTGIPNINQLSTSIANIGLPTTGLTVGQGSVLASNNTTASYLRFEAEL